MPLLALSNTGHTLSKGAIAYADHTRQAFVSAYTDNDNQHFIAIIDQQGNLAYRYRVPSRGHSACVNKSGNRVAFFARRPRRWLLVIDAHTGQLIGEVNAPPGTHYYGHGVFSSDGTLLYASENDYQNNRGVIGIYDVQRHLKRIDELPSYGIGPHDLGLLSNDQTLVVANGGIQTHPDYGRIKLNLDTMDPNLAYIDLKSGDCLACYKPIHHQLSLRHIAISPHDQVIVAAQYQGKLIDDLPLVFSHQGEDYLVGMSGQPLNRQRDLKQYIASVAFVNNGKLVVTTSPRGGVVTVWDPLTRLWLRDASLPDVAGVSGFENGPILMLSSGVGNLYTMNSVTGEIINIKNNVNQRWDNHLKQLRVNA